MAIAYDENETNKILNELGITFPAIANRFMVTFESPTLDTTSSKLLQCQVIGVKVNLLPLDALHKLTIEFENDANGIVLKTLLHLKESSELLSINKI